VIEATDVERELDGVDVVLIAHEACYKLWCEESVARPTSAARRERVLATSSVPPTSVPGMKRFTLQNYAGFVASPFTVRVSTTYRY
jgi:hypothetical protein